jgi:2,4-dienoyl-CoA reductase (NADPH2)
MSTKFKNIFSPIDVGSMHMKNRLMSTSMSPGEGYTGKDMKPTQRFYNYLEERAKGGLGAICQTISFYRMDPEGHLLPQAFDESHIPHMKKMAEVVQKHGCKIVAQAFTVHEWRRKPDEDIEHWGPSDVRLPPAKIAIKPMTKEDIDLFIEHIARGAKIVQAAGWDAVELVAGVGAIMSRFMSKATNKRTDEYGPQSMENRCRLTVDCIKAIKNVCGEDFPVVVRWTPVDYIEGGNEMEDALQIAKILDDAGAAWHNLQIGWHESSVPVTIKTVPEGGFSWMGKEIKKVVKAPVAVGYRNTDPENMDRIIAEGHTDIIGGLRYSIADPEFGIKAEHGRENEIKKCICCCRCLDDVVSRGKPLDYCSVNPRLGAELDEEVGKAYERKNVMIVGSGPAGLSAAFTAYERGHDVTIYEKGPRVGGCLVMSAIFSPLYERMTKYYKTKLANTPEIKVKLKTTVTPELVQTMQPDAIIVAAGGEPRDLFVPGVNRANVIRSHDFLSLLNGTPPSKPGIVNKVMWRCAGIFLGLFYSPSLLKKMMWFPWPFGKKVAIIGGGLPGCELGIEMLHNNREMVIIEENKKIGFDVGGSERFHITSAFKKSPVVQMEPLSQVLEISNKGVTAQRADGSRFTYEADTVAVTLGFEENKSLYKSLNDRTRYLEGAGDCMNPQRMADATKAGYKAARGI